MLGLLRREPGYLEALSLVMTCIVLGRLLGIVLDGFDSQVGGAIAAETVTAAATFTVARQLRAPSQGASA